jgi:hypothetical protein
MPLLSVCLSVEQGQCVSSLDPPELTSSFWAHTFRERMAASDVVCARIDSSCGACCSVTEGVALQHWDS